MINPHRVTGRAVGRRNKAQKNPNRQHARKGRGMNRNTYTQLEQLPNIGPAIAEKLRRIGIRTPADIVGRDPYAMSKELEICTGEQCDPCLLDVFISAVRFMEGAPKKPWWAYTSERKMMLARKQTKRHV